EAVKKHGATLLTIESLQPGVEAISNVANLARHHICVPPDQFGPPVLGLLKAVVEGHHLDQTLSQQGSEFVSAVSRSLESVPWQELTGATGASREQFLTMAESLAKGRRVIVIVGQELLRSPGGYPTSVNLLDLLVLLGKLTARGCGLAPLAEENNDQGAIE